jgi:hypothetical protein
LAASHKHTHKRPPAKMIVRPMKHESPRWLIRAGALAFAVLFAAAGIATIFTVRAATPPLRTVAQWEQRFLGSWNTEHTNEYLGLSKAGDSWKLYNLAYAMDANVAMFRATGKTQYLDRALLYTNNAIGTAKVSSSISTSQYKDSYLTWPSFSHPDGQDGGREYPLYESYMWRYVTYMLRTMHDTPSVMNNAAYKSQYDKILAFTERNIYDKWNARGANDNIYRQNAHMASHWAYITMELAAITPNTTKKAAYTKVYTNINHKLPNYSTGLRGQIRTNPVNSGAYFWDYDWGKASRPGSDVSHGNAVLAYIVEAHDHGVEWTDADMSKFNTLLKSVIWKSNGSYAEYLDGSGSDNGWINDGFMKLGRYDPAIQRRLESYNVAQNTTFNANGALNAKILLTPATPTPTPTPAPAPSPAPTPTPAPTPSPTPTPTPLPLPPPGGTSPPVVVSGTVTVPTSPGSKTSVLIDGVQAGDASRIDTRQLTNGEHTVTVQNTAGDGSTSASTIPIDVNNNLTAYEKVRNAVTQFIRHNIILVSFVGFIGGVIAIAGIVRLIMWRRAIKLYGSWHTKMYGA